MWRTRVIRLSLTVLSLLAGCAPATSGRELRGASGPVAWEVVDVRQRPEEDDARMYWEYTVVLRNCGATVIRFEQIELGSRAVGSVDVSGGMDSEPFVRRLEPDRELRMSRSASWGCPRCGPGQLLDVLATGMIHYVTLTGRDAQGDLVTVQIPIRLNSRVGARE